MSLTLASKPTFIEWKNLRFLIMDAPKQANLHLYLKECEKYHVTQLVRISEPTYDKADVERAGITLHVSRAHIHAHILTHILGQMLASFTIELCWSELNPLHLICSATQEMCFDDGASPPQEIIDRWNDLVNETFKKKKDDSAAASPPCIAIHCVAGLGR
jgi:protein tyrosine phosphatase type 4A